MRYDGVTGDLPRISRALFEPIPGRGGGTYSSTSSLSPFKEKIKYRINIKKNLIC